MVCWFINRSFARESNVKLQIAILFMLSLLIIGCIPHVGAKLEILNQPNKSNVVDTVSFELIQLGYVKRNPEHVIGDFYAVFDGAGLNDAVNYTVLLSDGLNPKDLELSFGIAGVSCFDKKATLEFHQLINRLVKIYGETILVKEKATTC